MLRCEGFEMVALLAALVGHLRGRDDFRLEISEEGAGSLIALEWAGARFRSRNWMADLRCHLRWGWPMSPDGAS
ncbi:hypothetical protein LZA78_17365 [Sinirhodobacter sp. WL0062]|uniref:Uncharacterized protein n=1 Tax=Rhodobacter flavimaris TaxID=2907145 RepID=A0ABS8YZK5_9RHOB|nr:hypothetical protein [Sinirhodobacter sp. WL0062]MCE5975232.1 hypothetical protein [Sinirhodobacter sp. WL0062]